MGYQRWNEQLLLDRDTSLMVISINLGSHSFSLSFKIKMDLGTEHYSPDSVYLLKVNHDSL